MQSHDEKKSPPIHRYVSPQNSDEDFVQIHQADIPGKSTGIASILSAQFISSQESTATESVRCTTGNDRERRIEDESWVIPVSHSNENDCSLLEAFEGASDQTLNQPKAAPPMQNVEIIQDWHAVLGDKQSGNTSTTATQILKQVKQEFRQQHAGKNGSIWFDAAYEEYRTRMAQEFPHIPAVDRGRILVQCTPQVCDSRRVTKPFSYKYPDKTKALYGPAKLPEALHFFFKSKDPPTLEKEVERYRASLGRLRKDTIARPPTVMLDEFEDLLSFVERKIHAAASSSEGNTLKSILAAELLKNTKFIPILARQFKILNEHKQDVTTSSSPVFLPPKDEAASNNSTTTSRTVLQPSGETSNMLRQDGISIDHGHYDDFDRVLAKLSPLLDTAETKSRKVHFDTGTLDHGADALLDDFDPIELTEMFDLERERSSCAESAHDGTIDFNCQEYPDLPCDTKSRRKGAPAIREVRHPGKDHKMANVCVLSSPPRLEKELSLESSKRRIENKDRDALVASIAAQVGSLRNMLQQIIELQSSFGCATKNSALGDRPEILPKDGCFLKSNNQDHANPTTTASGRKRGRRSNQKSSSSCCCHDLPYQPSSQQSRNKPRNLSNEPSANIPRDVDSTTSPCIDSAVNGGSENDDVDSYESYDSKELRCSGKGAREKET